MTADAAPTDALRERLNAGSVPSGYVNIDPGTGRIVVALMRQDSDRRIWGVVEAITEVLLFALEQSNDRQRRLAAQVDTLLWHAGLQPKPSGEPLDAGGYKLHPFELRLMIRDADMPIWNDLHGMMVSQGGKFSDVLTQALQLHRQQNGW